MNDLDLC